MVERRILAPVYRMDQSKLSMKINEFCGSFPIILKEETTIDAVEKNLNG